MKMEHVMNKKHVMNLKHIMKMKHIINMKHAMNMKHVMNIINNVMNMKHVMNMKQKELIRVIQLTDEENANDVDNVINDRNRIENLIKELKRFKILK